VRAVDASDSLDEMSTETPQSVFEVGADRASYVRRMFNEIVPRYDLLNRVMTLGRDQSWRRHAARAIVSPGARVVDVGCGTGDLSLACLDVGAGEVAGLDFAAQMLPVAAEKARRWESEGAHSSRPAAVGQAHWVEADATQLPLADASVDAWCSAFVVRNIPALDRAFDEAYRVLRPGGRLAILEVPRLERGVLQSFARLHFKFGVPLLGRLISGHGSAYRYLPVSVDHFLTPAELTARLRIAGFRVREVRLFMLGTIALHVAEKPAGQSRPVSSRTASSREAS
jgi:demethylmenaquinone methyltransferase/2-methoxy-6-polyprenyl-1,4-benzoquinol methylase